MKAQQFLRDTFSLLYVLYFQPTLLAQRLHPGPADLRTTAIRLDSAIYHHQPARVQRYLWQLVLLCSSAATPLLILAPMAPQPPSPLHLLLTWMMIHFGRAERHRLAGSVGSSYRAGAGIVNRFGPRAGALVDPAKLGRGRQPTYRKSPLVW